MVDKSFFFFAKIFALPRGSTLKFYLLGMENTYKEKK